MSEMKNSTRMGGTHLDRGVLWCCCVLLWPTRPMERSEKTLLKLMFQHKMDQLRAGWLEVATCLMEN